MADADIQGMLVRIEATTAGLRRELDLGDSRVKKFADNTNRAGNSVDGAFGGMATSAMRLLAPLASAVSAFEALGKAVEVQRQFDVLNAGLITATGSSAKAAVAFDALQKFAAQTPYSLDQAVDGFTKLVNLGLTPSEAALNSYGNTAAAMGKDLNQMIEAVADAATGEFERLKEFGITSSQQGNKVSLTFRGVTTTIGKNAKEIEGYLLNLGNTDFAGAMDQRAKTLDGAISNLGDTWDTTFRLINERGLGDLMKESVDIAATALQDLNDSLASGQFEAYLDAVGGKFSGFTGDVHESLQILDAQFGEFFASLGPQAESTTAFLVSAFHDFPENVRAFIQLMTVEVLAGFDKAQAYAVAFKDSVKAVFTDDTLDQVGARLAGSLDVINQAREGSIEQILSERDTAVASYKQQSAAADERLRKYRQERDAALATGGDVLAQFGKQTTATNANTAASKELEAQKKREAKALADLKAQADIAIASATGLAAAYLAGTDKSRDFALQQKVEEALLKTGAAARDEVTDKLKKQRAAEELLAVSKQAYDLQQETTDLIAQAKATLMGTDALEAYNVQKAMQVALAGKNIEVGSKEYQQLLDATKAQQDAVKVAKQAGDAGSIMDRLYPQSKLLRDYTEDQKSLNAAMALYPEHAAEYQAALQRLGVEYEQNKNAATEWGKFTDGAVDRIDEAFANMWESVLSKSGDFMDTLKNSFRQFLAEMLHMAITKPIIVQIGSALGVGGLAASDGGSILSGLTGGGTGITSYLNTAKNVMSVAGSKFSESIMSGWNSGDGMLGGLQNAFSNGADYVQSAITSAFSTGSATAAQVAGNFAASTTPATVDLIGNTVSIGGKTVGTATGMTQTAAMTGLQTLGATLGYIQGAVSIFQSFQEYGLKGGAVAGGMAAAGAYIGSFVGPLGTAAGFAIGVTLGSLGAGKLFGSGEKYPDLSTSATGRYINGQYTDTGIAQNWQRNAPKYGSAADAQMSSTLNKFSTTLGMLYDTLGNGADVVAYNTLQQRKTSGKYSTTFGAQLDDGSVITGKQQFKADDIAAALTADYDDIMGTFLAKAIVSSKSLPDYFKAQFTDFANSWDTTADEVIKAIESVFTRFNGVNDALSLINVNNLKLDDIGLQASDSILNMVGAMSDLDTATATAKEKVDALNTAVSAYYQAFFTADEQFADLTKSLQGAFAGFGLELPDNRAAYRDMVEDIDVTTAAGQAMFATMMGLATNANSYYSTLEQKAKDAEQAAADAAQKIIDGLMGNASSAFNAVQRSITAQQKTASDAYNALTTSLNDMLGTANTNVSDLTGVSNDLSSALKALRGDSDDAVKMLRAQATATLQSALATAKAGGSLAGFAGLSDALDTVSNNSTDLYASLEDFNRDQGRTANVVAQLNALNGKQLTSAQQTVKTLQDQLDQAKKAYDAQMTQFDAQLAYAQSQLDALNGVDNSILGVTAAVNAMNAAVVAALSALPRTGAGSAAANTAQNNGTIIDSVYQSILGRDADAAGRNYWLGELANGHIAYDQLAQAVANAAREKGQAVVAPGYATGGLISGPGTGTTDSILARLSNGEFVMNADAVRMFGPDLLSQMNGLQIPAFAVGGPVLDVTGPSQVFSASRNQSSSGADGSGQLEQKVDVLIDVVKQIIGPMKVDSAKNQKLFSKWDKDGLPATTTASASA